MRALIICLTAVAVIIFAACGDDSNGGATATSSVASPVASAVPQTPAATCPTPPAGPQFAEVFTGAATSQEITTLADIQVTNSSCSDIVTFTFAGTGLPAYEVKYVQAALGCGSGLPITTAGPAQIMVHFEPAVAHDEGGQATVDPPPGAPNLPSIKELKASCDFEAIVEWVIGTEAKYYAVTTASNPPRLIVEVYH